jgi:hypothetical protein
MDAAEVRIDPQPAGGPAGPAPPAEPETGPAVDAAKPEEAPPAPDAGTKDPPKPVDDRKAADQERRQKLDKERRAKDLEAQRQHRADEERRAQAARAQRRRVELEELYRYPTSELAAVPDAEGRFRHLRAAADPQVKRLLSAGTLFVSGAHARIVESATLEVAFHEEFKELRKRKIFLDENPTYSLVTILDSAGITCLGETEPGLRDGGRDLVLVADVNSLEAFNVLRGCEARLTNTDRLQSRLFFVFRIYGEALKSWQHKPMETPLPEWKIDGLRELLTDYGADADESAAIVKALKAGQGEKRWPTEEREFLQEVDQTGGLKALHQEILNRQNTELEKLPAARARAIWAQAGLLEKAALFVGVFFPEISTTQFDQLVVMALAKDQIEIVEEEVITEGGTVKVHQKRRPVSAAERWEMQAEQALEKVGLSVAQTAEDNVVFRFEDGALREAFAGIYFPNQANTFFKRLHAADLLFAPDTRRELVQAFVTVTTGMAIRYRDVYNEDWLLEQLGEIVRRQAHFTRGAQAVVDGLSQDTEDRQSLSAAVAILEKQGGAYFRELHYRLSCLCQGMLAVPKTVDVVNRFISRLIDQTKPYGILPLRLIESLRRAPEFEVFKQLKTLLDQANEESRRAVVRSLIRQALESAESTWEILTQLVKWHPPREDDRKQSGSRLWSVAFIFALFEEYRARTEFEDALAGRRWDLHPLAPAANVPALEPRIETLAQWFSHPGFFDALEQVIEAANPELYAHHQAQLTERFRVGEACLAEMLESWHAGAPDDAVHRLATRLAGLLPTGVLERLRVLIRRIGESQDWTIFLTAGAQRQRYADRKARAFELASRLVPPTPPDR